MINLSVRGSRIQMSHAHLKFAKRHFFKANRNKEDQYFWTYDRFLLAADKRKFVQVCDSFEPSKSQRLSAMQCMLHDEALKYFTKTIRHTASSVDSSLDKLKDRFLTRAHMDKNTTE